MKIGVTGHQKRPGADWNWVRDQITRELSLLPKPVEGLSCLAEGADQIFAECIIGHGGSLEVVVPTDDYERFFSQEGLDNYLRLKARSNVKRLAHPTSAQASFFRAGEYIADHSDLILAIWDGKPAAEYGGTGDIVGYALERGIPVVQIDPIARTVRRLAGPRSPA